jgi:calcium binding protein
MPVGSNEMKKPKKDPIREDRIHNEAIVDAYGAEERAMGWYYYLENQLQFPFQARCIAANIVSPLSKGETVESSAWHRKNPAQPICSCSSAGKAGNWRCLYPNWPRSTRINQQPMPSAIGIIG